MESTGREDVMKLDGGGSKGGLGSTRGQVGRRDMMGGFVLSVV